MLQKVKEATYGPHVYMMLEDQFGIEEIDVFYRNDGILYRTTADNDPERRKEIITAFCDLY